MPAYIDLTNQRFGRLTVLRRAPNNGRHTAWFCRCECGRETAIDGSNLTGGCHTKSCGCLRGKLLEAGQRFGRLTVVERMPPKTNGRGSWLCLCDCGNETTVITNHLTNGNTKSCGCLHGELFNHLTHGDTRSSEYSSWCAMIARCYNPSHIAYKRYGGRGITICTRWRNSYEVFLADMGRKPSPAHSIDRIDNNGNYTPSNCRWVTASEQNYNRRNFKRHQNH